MLTMGGGGRCHFDKDLETSTWLCYVLKMVKHNLRSKTIFLVIDHDKIGIKCNKVMTMKIQALLEFGVFACVNVKG